MRTIPHDKANHAVAGSWVGLVGALAGRFFNLPPGPCAIGLAFVVGLAREAYGKHKTGVWSNADIAWTVTGSAPVAIVAGV